MIATVQDLKDYMSGITLSIEQAAAAENVLAGVQAEIETFLNRPIESGDIYTETVTTDESGWLYPSNTPVASIISLSADGRPITMIESLTTTISTGLPSTPVSITYTAGLSGRALAVVKLTMLRVAAREIQNKHDDTLSVKDLGTQDVSPLPEGLQDEDRARINRYRRRVAR